MAHVNGRGHKRRDLQPPPSSVLASHLTNDQGRANLSHDGFAQLLEEALSNDENGESNITSDIAINTKLLVVVTSVGIEPFLDKSDNDPFRGRIDQGRNAAQLNSCLEVIQTVISRSPTVVYQVLNDDETSPSLSCLPMFAWLIPVLLCLSIQSKTPTITAVCTTVLQAFFEQDGRCLCYACGTIRIYLLACYNALLSVIDRVQTSAMDEAVILTEDDCVGTSAIPSKHLLASLSLLRCTTYAEVICAASEILQLLQARCTDKAYSLQLKKQHARLQLAVRNAIPRRQKGELELQDLQRKIAGLVVQSKDTPDLDYFPEREFSESERATKRARLSTDVISDDTLADPKHKIINDMIKNLTGISVSDLDSLRSTCPQFLHRSTEEVKSAAILQLGLTACRLSEGSTVPDFVCPVCDTGTKNIAQLDLSYDLERLHETLVALKPLYDRRSSLRICAVESLRRVIAHSVSDELVKLTDSFGGKIVLQALRSPSRDLRLVVSQCLQSFVRNVSGRTASITRTNRIVALELLERLWQTGQVTAQEIVVLSLVRLAEVVDEEELNIILVRLVEYLGHTNPYISSLVVSELSNLALSLDMRNPNDLLRPFWRTIAPVVVKNLNSRPMIAQQLCELLGTQVPGFLVMVEEYVLPYLVLDRKVDVIQRIASSSSSPMHVFDLCVKAEVLPKILAHLLAQAFSDPEDAIMKLLVRISSEFAEQDLAAWLSLNNSKVAMELLKTAGDAGPGKSSKVYQGLQTLAQLAWRKPSGSSSMRKSDYLPAFLENNALEIVTLFSVKLDDIQSPEPGVEKRRYLKALGEVVKLGRNRVGVVLPQICACLRDALNDPQLCDAAFSAWSSMLLHSNEETVIEMLDQTFAVIIHSWDDFDTDTHQAAFDLLEALFKKYPGAIKDNFRELPSLSSIPLLRKFDDEVHRLKKQLDERHVFLSFIDRLQQPNVAVLERAIIELVQLLETKQNFIRQAILQEPPDSLIAELIRAILDICPKFDDESNLAFYASRCLGLIGCVDSSKIESPREKSSIIMLSNFADGIETTGFLLLFLDQIVVKEYVTASTLRSKGFFGWAIQELLKLCGISLDITSRTRTGGLGRKDQLWADLPEETRLVLTPFLNSKYLAPAKREVATPTYPIFKPGMSYDDWLTDLTLDLLNRATEQNSELVFDVCWRMVFYGKGNSVAAFLLPYAAMNLLLSGSERERENILGELLSVLRLPLVSMDAQQQQHAKRCSQSVFDVLDYMTKWLQEKRKLHAALITRAERGIRDPSIDIVATHRQIVEKALSFIPADIITQRSIECKSFARALCHWEEHIHSLDNPSDDDYRRLQTIYSEIDEPDGVEGISSCMRILSIESQVLEYRKAGHGHAAQNWYENELIVHPDDIDVQLNLLQALSESGQYESLLQHFDGISKTSSSVDGRVLALALEAAWSSASWDKLATLVQQSRSQDYTNQLSSVLVSLRKEETGGLEERLDELSLNTVKELTLNSTATFSTSSTSLLKLHAINDARSLAVTDQAHRVETLNLLDTRLQTLGTNISGKHHLLNLRRAIMELRPATFNREDIAASWRMTAKLARKAEAPNQAFDAISKAIKQGDQSATIEQAKLMWLQGEHRKAIKTLEGAIQSGAFRAHSYVSDKNSMTASTATEQNNMTAKAFLLLGRWLDQSGQTQSDVIIKTFRKATENNKRYEKGWYHLGKHYNKILESEKLKPPGKESQSYLNGEAARTVIENFLRASTCGHKHVFETLPKALTLWLELVSHPALEQDSRRGNAKFHEHLTTTRKKLVADVHVYFKKYVERLLPVALYTILSQVVARLCHSDHQIYEVLQTIIVKVIRAYPQQALWTLMAITKSQDKLRATRGTQIIGKIVEMQKKDPKGGSPSEMRTMIAAAQKFTDEVLRIADYTIEGKVSRISLARDLGFNHKIAPSRLVVPAESCLIPNIPPTTDARTLKDFRVFPRSPAVIQSFVDDALVLSSLQKPRKLSLRGTDGNIYSILAKPKDDLRKDQRLMEFDTMINRFLKHDIEASKRQLYIRTYAVIPLNEECGLIEWVDNLKTMRDILLKLYRERNVQIDYGKIRSDLDDICARSSDKATDFKSRVLKSFPAMLRHWFVETFPDPTAWLAARIRYTRSTAVMSMVGHILGLGDRHGENILFEEDNGGIMHVDFNCLFDKGLTFDKPELVPFRLTHNMVDAFGVFGIEGPFRKCSEITMRLLRGNEDGLMTILETFLHDPTTDFMTTGKRKKAAANVEGGIVPDTAEKMLEGVRGKVRGMLVGESVPLGVGGYVEEMMRQATDRARLARMYIGWCAFL